jgi:hypothetical protein
MTATLAAGGLLTQTERTFDPRATCDHCGVAPAAVKWVFRSRNLSGTHHCLYLCQHHSNTSANLLNTTAMCALRLT